MTIELIVTQVDWIERQKDLKYIRAEVFVNEQQVPIEEEWDGRDETAIHFLATVKSKPRGTARLLTDGQITRMAVLKPFRGQGIGSALLKKSVEVAQSRGITQPFLHAQTHALSFYEDHDFVAHGKEFLDAGIPHFAMTYQPKRQ